MEQQPNAGLSRLMLRFVDHTRLDTVRRTGLYLHNTQRAQEINTHCPSGIRTYDPRNRAATDSRLRPQGLREGRNENIAPRILYFGTGWR